MLTEVGWVVAAEIVLIDSKVTLESSPCQTNFEIVKLLGYEMIDEIKFTIFYITLTLKNLTQKYSVQLINLGF